MPSKKRSTTSKRPRGGGRADQDPDDPRLSVLEARKIRNRLSAAASRDRARKHVEGLEERVAELERENAALRRENERLRAPATSTTSIPQILEAPTRIVAPVVVPTTTEPPLKKHHSHRSESAVLVYPL